MCVGIKGPSVAQTTPRRIIDNTEAVTDQNRRKRNARRGFANAIFTSSTGAQGAPLLGRAGALGPGG